MVAANTDGIGSGKFLHGIFDRIANETNGWPYRKDPCSAPDNLLENIVLRGGAHSVFLKSSLCSGRLEHGQHDACHGIDGEPGANPVKRDALEGHFEITKGIDRHTDSSHFTLSQWVIGIKPHLRREIEGHIESCLAMRNH